LGGGGKKKNIQKITLSCKNIFEKDSNSIYELDERNKSRSSLISIKELDGRSIYELQGEGVRGYSTKGYIPYRPKPVELDGRPKTTGSY